MCDGSIQWHLVPFPTSHLEPTSPEMVGTVTCPRVEAHKVSTPKYPLFSRLRLDFELRQDSTTCQQPGVNIAGTCAGSLHSLPKGNSTHLDPIPQHALMDVFLPDHVAVLPYL